ncbi:unnamed protein product [Prunus armeniaca]|uniref:Chalcone isomerase domain-containing protein n=1 Tax=Prunus armeniaca TaxID=36596 RepID=A0A6J5UFS2_PRUAR|nr:unnamed protein product [Prunus armeniaca]
MAAIVGLGDVTAKAEMVETEPKIDKVNGTESISSNGESIVKDNGKCENGEKAVEEPNSLGCVGLRKKSMLGMGIKNYGFGIYADNEKLRELLKLKIGKAPAKPTKEMYQLVIDSDAEMMVRLVIVFSSLTMNMVRKNFDEGLGASIKKLTGGKKNEALANKVMGQASDDIKLTSRSVIEISRLLGNILQTKGDNSKTLICIKIVIYTLEMNTTLTKSCVLLGAVIGEVVSKVESELLCRAYVNMYLGDDPLDKDTKEKFGMSLPSLF